jgi:large subunit ribosomal protein L4
MIEKDILKYKDISKSIKLIDKMYDCESNPQKYIGLIHKVYNCELKNSRKFRASTKTRAEVRGGGKKPWRQKGTGNARAGSIRSSIWVGGGVSFGPKPKIIRKKINKKEKRLAIFSALFLKKMDWIMLSHEAFENFQNIKKTKDLKIFLEKILGNYYSKKKLIILPKIYKNIYLASRNLKNIKLILANALNLRKILESEILIFDRTSFNIFYNIFFAAYYEKST